ncbi:MAG: hypothetical protein GY849_14045 [Deltaproteobacteria bacterium]|nr:hypothetical protein [Deltaproteobacteria bacterium]
MSSKIPIPDVIARNDQLDFVKGALVLTMIIYHEFLNFYDHYEHIINITKYASGGFIYLSGFIVGYHYLQNYNDQSKIGKRLLLRSAKIFFIFFVANLDHIVLAVIAQPQGTIDLLSHHFVSGTGRSRFEILLPISYLLAFLAIASGPMKRYYRTANVLVLVMIILVDLRILPLFVNLWGMLIGLAGLCHSLVIKDVKGRSFIKTGILCVAMAVLIGWVRLEWPWGKTMVVYILYIVTVLGSFYILANFLHPDSLCAKWVLLIGRYPLFSYLYHIIIIVLAAKIIGHKFDLLGNVIGVMLVAVFLIGSVFLLDRLRKTIPIFDRSYKLIFA